MKDRAISEDAVITADRQNGSRTDIALESSVGVEILDDNGGNTIFVEPSCFTFSGIESALSIVMNEGEAKRRVSFEKRSTANSSAFLPSAMKVYFFTSKSVEEVIDVVVFIGDTGVESGNVMNGHKIVSEIKFTISWLYSCWASMIWSASRILLELI